MNSKPRQNLKVEKIHLSFIARASVIFALVAFQSSFGRGDSSNSLPRCPDAHNLIADHSERLLALVKPVTVQSEVEKEVSRLTQNAPRGVARSEAESMELELRARVNVAKRLFSGELQLAPDAIKVRTRTPAELAEFEAAYGGLSMEQKQVLYKAHQEPSLKRKAEILRDAKLPGKFRRDLIEGYVCGGKVPQQLMGWSSIEELPPALRARWEKGVNKIDFPLPTWKTKKWLPNGISYGDIDVLAKIVKNKVLRMDPPKVGRLNFHSDFVFIEGIFDSPGKPREVLLSVNKNRYRVRLTDHVPLAPNPETGRASGLRAPASSQGHLRNILDEGTLSAEERAWLQSTEANGTSVLTREGSIFTQTYDSRLGELGVCWRDEKEGLIWSSVVKEEMPFQKAVEYCQKLGRSAHIATKEEYDLLAKKAGHHILSNQHEWYWAPHISLDNKTSAVSFSSDSGLEFRGIDFMKPLPFRCVARMH